MDSDEHERIQLLTTDLSTGSLTAQDDYFEETHLPKPRNRCFNVSQALLMIMSATVMAALLLVVIKFPSQGSPKVLNDPPWVYSPQFSLSSLPVLSPEPSTREYFWTVTRDSIFPAGVSKSMLLVNGLSPGPLIQANSDDRIVVHVTNALENETTSIHWHGLYQNGTNVFDGAEGITQCGIPPGETMTYNFTLDGWIGTTWWHSHSSTQHTDGMYGAIIVQGPETVPPYDGGDLVMLLSDYYNEDSRKLSEEYLKNKDIEVAPEPVPDTVVINGLGQRTSCSSECNSNNGHFWNFTVSHFKTYRLRLINSGSFAAIHFSIDNHLLTVIEADGTAVVPQPVSSLSLEPAQRYSVLLKTDQEPGSYWIRARLDERMFAYTNPTMNPVGLGVLQYDIGVDVPLLPNSSSVSTTGSLDSKSLTPADILDAPIKADMLIPWKFSIQRTRARSWRSFINNTSWEPLPLGTFSAQNALSHSNLSDGNHLLAGDQLITVVNSVKVVDFAISNLDDGDHPFHLHGYKPWIVGQGSGRYIGQQLSTVNPMRRDTFLIPAFHWMVVRIVTDLPGYWSFHCHVAWHMAAGAIFQVVTLPSQVNQLGLPEDIERHCAMVQ